MSKVFRKIEAGSAEEGFFAPDSAIRRVDREMALRLIAGSTRAALPVVPSVLRVVPHARAAEANPAGSQMANLKLQI